MDSYFGVEFPKNREERMVFMAKLLSIGDAYPEWPLIVDEISRAIRSKTPFKKSTYKELIMADNIEINLLLAVHGTPEAVEAFLEMQSLNQEIIAALMTNPNLEDKERLRKFINTDTTRGQLNKKLLDSIYSKLDNDS